MRGWMTQGAMEEVDFQRCCMLIVELNLNFHTFNHHGQLQHRNI